MPASERVRTEDPGLSLAVVTLQLLLCGFSEQNFAI